MLLSMTKQNHNRYWGGGGVTGDAIFDGWDLSTTNHLNKDKYKQLCNIMNECSVKSKVWVRMISGGCSV